MRACILYESLRKHESGQLSDDTNVTVSFHMDLFADVIISSGIMYY